MTQHAKLNLGSNPTQNVAVLGATGSIGDSTLEVLARHSDRFNVYAVSGHQRLDKLFAICQTYRPTRVAVPDDAMDDFAQRLADAGIICDVVGGEGGLTDLAGDSDVDTVVCAIVGSAGLPSTLKAVQTGKRVLLANKEALVMAGELMMQTARKTGATILPVDSEHNAIFQCLPQTVQTDNQAIHADKHGIKQLWLTASGGPFLNASFDQMQKASVSEAVAHPNWSMGAKISIDSATMMNKGLELIEACHLFNLPEDRISVVMHPQSIIHSMVQYTDGSFLAQMGSPDMKTPIAHALAYPERIEAGVQALDFFTLQDLQFIEPDLEKFACLRLAREAMRAGQGACIALNASNEVAVEAFINEQVCLTDIALINETVVGKMASQYLDTIQDLADIMTIDAMARQLAKVTANEAVKGK